VLLWFLLGVISLTSPLRGPSWALQWQCVAFWVIP
jgi:hypothetical protein